MEAVEIESSTQLNTSICDETSILPERATFNLITALGNDDSFNHWGVR